MRKLVMGIVAVALLFGGPIVWFRFFVAPELNSVCNRLKDIATDEAKKDYLVRWALKVAKEPNFSLLRDIDTRILRDRQLAAFEALGFDIEVFGSNVDRFRIGTVPKSRFWKEGDEPFEIDFVKFVSARDFIVVNVADLTRDLGQKDGSHMKTNTLKYSVTHIDDRVAVYCD